MILIRRKVTFLSSKEQFSLKKKRKKKQIRTEESIKTMEREYIENRKKERKKVKTQRLDKFN